MVKLRLLRAAKPKFKANLAFEASSSHLRLPKATEAAFKAFNGPPSPPKGPRRLFDQKSSFLLKMAQMKASKLF